MELLHIIYDTQLQLRTSDEQQQKNVGNKYYILFCTNLVELMSELSKF
jgi:hypothetical protein